MNARHLGPTFPPPRATADLMRPPPFHLRRSPTVRVALLAALAATAASAADLPPAVVASFTRRVQPLVLNRCAAGACHGGPDAPEPQFRRAIGDGQPDRLHTLANLRAFLDAVGPDRDPRSLAALLAAGHPGAETAAPRRAALVNLTGAFMAKAGMRLVNVLGHGEGYE